MWIHPRLLQGVPIILSIAFKWLIRTCQWLYLGAVAYSVKSQRWNYPWLRFSLSDVVCLILLSSVCKPRAVIMFLLTRFLFIFAVSSEPNSITIYKTARLWFKCHIVLNAWDFKHLEPWVLQLMWTGPFLEMWHITASWHAVGVFKRVNKRRALS